MFLKLRIIFTIIATAFLVVFFPVGYMFGFGWAAIAGIGAFVFFVAMLLCKQEQELRESKKEEENAPPVGDFLNPLPSQENTGEQAPPENNKHN